MYKQSKTRILPGRPAELAVQHRVQQLRPDRRP
jgi:hypothetical protein